MIKRLKIALVAAFTVLSGSNAWAQNIVSLADIAQVTVLPGWRTEQGTHMAAIRIDLADGWKTYWRAPGEAGIPPSFDWAGSKNLAAVKLHWPTPKIFYTNGYRSIGYKGVTVIPIELTPKRPGGQAIKLRGQMQLGVCEDVCIPMDAQLKADLTGPGTHDPSIRASLTHQPQDAASAGGGKAICTIEPIADGLRVSIKTALPRQGGDEVAIIEVADPSVWVAAPETRRKGNMLLASTDLVAPSGTPFALSRSDIRMTVFGAKNAVEFLGCTAG